MLCVDVSEKYSPWLVAGGVVGTGSGVGGLRVPVYGEMGQLIKLALKCMLTLTAGAPQPCRRTPRHATAFIKTIYLSNDMERG